MKRPALFVLSVCLVAMLASPVAGTPGYEGFDFRYTEPDWVLVWDDVDGQYDVFFTDGSPLQRVDDRSTHADERSVDLDGEPFNQSRYEYNERADYMRYEVANDTWIDITIMYPMTATDALDPTGQAAAGFMHDAVRRLTNLEVLAPCGAAPATYPAITGSYVDKPTDWWVFQGFVPEIFAYWGVVGWCGSKPF